MIRPIDTQILYTQSAELSNRQQVANQSTLVQQNQFAELMQKEVQTKKEQVQKTASDEKVKNDKKEGNRSNYSEQEKKDKKDKDKQTKDPARGVQENKRQIDIKI